MGTEIRGTHTHRDTRDYRLPDAKNWGDRARTNERKKTLSASRDDTSCVGQRLDPGVGCGHSFQHGQEGEREGGARAGGDRERRRAVERGARERAERGPVLLGGRLAAAQVERAGQRLGGLQGGGRVLERFLCAWCGGGCEVSGGVSRRRGGCEGIAFRAPPHPRRPTSRLCPALSTLAPRLDRTVHQRACVGGEGRPAKQQTHQGNQHTHTRDARRPTKKTAGTRRHAPTTPRVPDPAPWLEGHSS